MDEALDEDVCGEAVDRMVARCVLYRSVVALGAAALSVINKALQY